MTVELSDDQELDTLSVVEEVYCPECGARMDPDQTTCPRCGAQFSFYCPVCDEEIPAEATICPHCGAELDEGFEDEGSQDEGFYAGPGGAAEEGERETERATFCGNCGEPIGEDDEECPSCGVDLCPECGSPLDPGDTACPECGTEFVFTCPECGEELGLDEDVCPHCGFEFGEEEESLNDE
jgi:predicted amidophosphoribosyltransferase